MADGWKGFITGSWNQEINVIDFIQTNYCPYEGGDDFLCGPTDRSLKLLGKLTSLLVLEQEWGGVLDIDTTNISSLLTHAPGYLDRENEIIVGLQTNRPLRRAVNPFGGIKMAKDACRSYGYELDSKVEEIFAYRSTHNDGVFRVYTDEMRDARRSGVITGLPDAYGRGRIIGDYRRVPLYGVDRLIQEREKDKKRLGKESMSEENIRLLEECFKQIDFLNKLKEMAIMYGFDISRPAENAREAVQWLYFAYLGAIKEQNGAAMSLGRVSTFLDIYFERDIKAGEITEVHVQELIDDFVMKLRMARHLRTPEYNELFAGDPMWITEAVGGMGEDGRTLVTKTSYRFLNTLYNLGAAPEPNLTVLWSKDLPITFKEYCGRVSIETSAIQYENDDIMRPIYGDDYGIACCVSAMKIGKQMQYFGARCNLPKVLLMALNGGRDEISGAQIGPKREAIAGDELCFDSVIESFNFYRDWLCNLYVNTMNVIHYMHDKYSYEKLQMALHDISVERFMAFGIAGLSVVADSLSAIKYTNIKPVRDKKGLIVDFNIQGKYPSYGNDDDRVDSIATGLCRDFTESLRKTPAYRNAQHTLSVLTITSNVVYGNKTGATPDGRKKGQPFAPGANPMHGREVSGALLSLNSIAKLPYELCRDGISSTFTVTPSTIGKTLKSQKQNFVAILDGFFIQAGHHINVNVLNKEQLIEAMKYPQLYPNLTIRVSGYAVNFNRLSTEQQQEVISRTFHDKF